MTKSAGYRQCWAVVIGVNYRHLDGAAAQEVPPLDTAEQDAKAIYETLLANYGYSAENTKLLLGNDATREGIRQLLGESFLGDRERVTKEDAVVFYFAGHGNRREKVTADQQFVGLLYPSDLRVLPGKGVDTVSCLQIRELLDCLRDLCPARHKLVVLDSCHSGEVFNLKSNRSAGVNREFQPTLFHQPAFEAIAAAGAGQKAGDQDATGEHSPFTRAPWMPSNTVQTSVNRDRSRRANCLLTSPIA